MNNNKKNSLPLLYKVNTTWTSSEKSIMGFLNSFSKKTFILSQKQLANKTYTSEATISRFCKKFGFETYKSFIFYFNQLLLEHSFNKKINYSSSNDSVNDLFYKNYPIIKNTLNNLVLKKIEQTSTLIVRSKRIIVFSYNYSKITANELTDNLLKIGLNVFLNSDFSTMVSFISTSDCEDLYIIFSNKSDNKELDFILEEIKKSNSKTVLITVKNNIFKEEYIDLKIWYEKNVEEKEYIPIVSKISELLIIDSIFEHVIKHKTLFKSQFLKKASLLERWKNLNKKTDLIF